MSRTGSSHLNCDARDTPGGITASRRKHRTRRLWRTFHSVFVWLHANASQLGVDPGRIGIKGESGGGGFAAGAALYARERSGPKFAFQHLIYPMIDDRTAIRDDLASLRRRIHLDASEQSFRAGRSPLGDEPGSAGVSPYAAAARATDVSGLPPTYISVGGLDLFLEENMTYADSIEPGRRAGWVSLLPASVSRVRSCDECPRDQTGRARRA